MKIPSELYEALLRQASEFEESCGVLWGRYPGRILDFSSYPGPLHSHHFKMCDTWLLRQCYQRRTRGHRVVGFYHSHPGAGPMQPSLRDLEGHPLGSVALILSGLGESARAFRRQDSPARFEEIPIISA